LKKFKTKDEKQLDKKPKSNTTFEEHIPKGKYESLVEKGELFEGILRISQNNNKKGFVNV
jgi:hypothetical protein